VHNEFYNFYNEPPFADRLSGLAAQNRIPDSAQYKFVDAVITCATGNRYGVSRAAMPAYTAMIRSFSPAEIKIMLDLPTGLTIVGNRIRAYPECRSRFKGLVALVDTSSVPTSARTAYNTWMHDQPG
jgi:hypothetical protein